MGDVELRLTEFLSRYVLARAGSVAELSYADVKAVTAS